MSNQLNSFHAEFVRQYTLQTEFRITTSITAYIQQSSDLHSKLATYTRGEVTSQNLWSRYDRHVVGITWHDVWS